MNNNTCKYCGKEFIGRRNQKYCKDECRIEADKERKRKAYRKKHHSNGVDCNHCGKTFTPNKNGAKYKYCSEECSKEERRKRKRERWRKQNPDWNKKIIKKCEWCGDDYSVPKRNAHQARFCSDKCNNTWWSRVVYGHKPIEERNAERRERRLKRQAKLEKERAIRTLRSSLIRVIKHKEEQERIKRLTRECEECGTMFYDPHPHTLTCSSECSRKRSNRLSRYYERKRINKYNLVDKDISLKRLYKRDKGICYLCGEPCDYNDKIITDEGHYIVGETYPSIDHVIPISKGGKHSWNNVKLAHHRCNTLKSDSLIDSEKALV